MTVATVPPVIAEAVGGPSFAPLGAYCEAGFTASHEGELYEAWVRGIVFTLCIDCAILHNAEEISE